MKKLYLPLLLAISFVSKAQILDSTKVENAKVGLIVKNSW